jgi:hypothetical protein
MYSNIGIKRQEMNEFEEFELLKHQLIDHYQQEMALSKHAHTLPVNQQEVEIVKKLILLAGGREAQDVMIECWNIARIKYTKLVFENIAFYSVL